MLSTQGFFGIQCYGITRFPDSGEFMLILDYMEYGSLNDFLECKEKKFTWKEIYFLLRQIFKELTLIHVNDIVHKDLHPGNILSDQRGWFISDLGLCGSADKNPADKVFGIMPYIAPEVLFDKKYTPSADIYSMGIIMWQLITRCIPFHDREFNFLLASDIKKGLRPPPIFGLHPDYEHIMKRCWDDEPSRRPEARGLFSYFDKKLNQMYKGEYVLQDLEFDFTSYLSDNHMMTRLTMLVNMYK
ncbi:kinase-like domain-containing protein [Gigaspora rosea]|uniref:Kinase-like domain-containing protein n=1 Tax=Gigaspora rosea TaxID=44941 RepID=A0A397UEW6_9GLOM|nr:kinase-like domain-containing protein [Gigaspora rosea]